MKKIYYLKTCSTCKKIIKELELSEDFVFQDIKSQPLTPDNLEELKKIAGTYEVLFSKRAQLYKAYNLKEKILSEDDYKNYILEHYTFLKRPVIIINNMIFIGNSKSTIEAVKKELHEL